jgi:hypothetical protein
MTSRRDSNLLGKAVRDPELVLALTLVDFDAPPLS